MTSQWQRSTPTTPLSPRQQVAQAAQRRYRDHVKVCSAPVFGGCWTCDHLDAVAAGLWVRAAAVAEQREGVTA